MIKAKCLKCSVEFLTYPSKVKQGRGKYCSKDCSQSVFIKLGILYGEQTRFKKGQRNPNAKGWRYGQSRKGGPKYILLYKPDCHGASKSGYIRAHRFIMQEHLGRPLTKDEVVHHKDHNTLNNDISNLELMDKITHCRLHVGDNIHKRWGKEVAV